MKKRYFIQKIKGDFITAALVEIIILDNLNQDAVLLNVYLVELKRKDVALEQPIVIHNLLELSNKANDIIYLQLVNLNVLRQLDLFVLIVRFDFHV
jgi:hypothetical protein